MIWHSSKIEDILKELTVDENKGLANGVAEDRLQHYGPNVISNIEKPTFLKRFLTQLNNKFVYALIAIALVSFGLSLLYKESGLFSPILIIAIVFLNALISAYYLYRGDNALNALKSITNPTATVIRDGIIKSLPSDELVPGDIMLLKEGDYITADARLIESDNLRCNESVLTNVNIPIEKKCSAIVEDIAQIEKRTNMVFSGCSVVHGTAKAVVVDTGLSTEIGHTSSLIQQTGRDSLPLQSALDSTGKIVNIIILIICAISFSISIIQNFSTISFASMTVENLLNSLALAVAAIPEGLPAISTIVIALGIQRIIGDGIIIKKAQALEILGKTSVICSDKTGILTSNHMQLDRIYDGNRITQLENDELCEKTAMALRLAAACSTLENDQTERAIKNACIEYNSMSQTDVENIFPRLCVIPFDSERKTMTSINMINGRPIAIVKGAPEIIIEKCVGCDREAILKINDSMAEEALRVVCIAIKGLDEIPANPNPNDIENELTFVGLFGLFDPPRFEAINGIKSCEEAGIRTIMMTGDNILTAKAVARRIGILKDGTFAITGSELMNISDDELAENIHKYSVFARITPADKERIVAAWQARGDIVTITGDSIYDSDALALADIGCAMGKYGTDVAKGNADIIISNNNFVSIVNAIKESRGLFANIKKSVSYLLSCNFAEVLIFLIGLIIFKKPILIAAQLLWINLLTDCAPAIALSIEKAEANVMKEKPVTLQGHIFDSVSIFSIGIEAAVMAIITILSFSIGNVVGYEYGITMAFLTLGLAQIFHCYNTRVQGTIFKSTLNFNSFLTVSTILTAFIFMFLSLTPAGFVFGMKILNLGQFFICIAFSLAIIPCCEILKIFKFSVFRK